MHLLFPYNCPPQGIGLFLQLDSPPFQFRQVLFCNQDFGVLALECARCLVTFAIVAGAAAYALDLLPTTSQASCFDC